MVTPLTKASENLKPVIYNPEKFWVRLHCLPRPPSSSLGALNVFPVLHWEIQASHLLKVKEAGVTVNHSAEDLL